MTPKNGPRNCVISGDAPPPNLYLGLNAPLRT